MTGSSRGERTGNAPGACSVELYDPATGIWSATGALATARDSHTASLLPSGKILIAGGSSGSTRFASAEIYDPGTGLWTGTGLLGTARSQRSATLLTTGKVLVVGGTTAGGFAMAFAVFGHESRPRL